MAPGQDAGRRRIPGLQYDDILMAADQLGCGSQADRSGAQNGDRQRAIIGCGIGRTYGFEFRHHTPRDLMSVDAAKLACCFDSCQYGVVTITRQPGAAPAGSCCPSPDGSVELSAGRAETLAGVLKALADPVRLRLYWRIAAPGGEVCVCDIQDVGVSQPTVSHHLRKLREAGLIDCQRRGTWVYYRAVPGSLDLLAELPRP